MPIEIKHEEDWQELIRQELTTVLDPMIFRCGELFLSGPKKDTDNSATWDLLDKNIHAIAMFFDFLILAEKLPVFNYGDTFDAGLNFDQRVLARINDYETVLFDVDVTYAAYHSIKNAALAQLRDVFAGPQKIIKPELAQEVLAELSTSEYKWSPSLGGIELADDRLVKLSQFLLGGMIFCGYAQQLGSEHILQPKRSRLFLAVSLRTKSASFGFEEELFRELRARTNVRCVDLPWRPSLFPYLLSKANDPLEMLCIAAELRASSEVRDYRSWFAERIEEWDRDGKITFDAKKDVTAIATLYDYACGALSSIPKIEVKATIADVAAAAVGVPTTSVAADMAAPLKRLVGWALSSVPGKRYRKLLSRALVEDAQYKLINNRVKTVWEGGAG